MSGGSYHYFYDRLLDFASELQRNHREKPHVMALARLCQSISGVAYKIEWADSGDTSWTSELDDEIRELVGPREELTECLVAAVAAQRALSAAIERAEAK